MDRNRVERCVGLGFKDVAEEFDESAPGGRTADPDATAARRRRDFAHQYLEKLINIEVPVPVATAEQARELMGAARDAGTGGGTPTHTPAPQAPSPPAPKWKRAAAAARGGAVAMARGGYRAARAAAGSALFWMAVVALLMFVFGYELPGPDPAVQTAGDAGARRVPTPHPVQRDAGNDHPTGDEVNEERQAEPADPDARPGEVVTGGRVGRPLLFAVLFGLPLGFIAWLVLRQRPDVVVSDSGEFTNALEIWHRLIYGQRCTPRSVKRYLNHVRYYAMCQRRHPPRPTAGERLAGWWRDLTGRRRGADRRAGELKAGAIPEENLVALGAIHYFHPHWMRDPGTWEHLKAGDFPDTSKAPDDDVGGGRAGANPLHGLLEEAVEQHRRKFGKAPFNDEHRRTLIEMYPALAPE
jgi:hypothetical protein